MKWNDAMSKLAKLSSLVADEKLEKTGMFGVLHFFPDGYVYSSNGFFEFELYYGGDFRGAVPASKFYDVVKVLDQGVAYDVLVEDGFFVIRNSAGEVRINMIQVDQVVNRIGPVLSRGELESSVQVDWRDELLKVLRRESEVASSGSSSVEYRVIYFDRRGVFATDRVRVVCYFVPFIVGESAVLLSVNGIRQLVEIAGEEHIVGAWVIDGRLFVKFDGEFYVGVLGYDIEYPDVVGVLLGHKEKVERVDVDVSVSDEISKIVKILDPSDVLYLVVDNGWLELKVNSLKGFEWKKKLQRVNIEGEYVVGVLARDLDGVIDGGVELGFSNSVLYVRSVEGVEYVVSIVV